MSKRYYAVSCTLTKEGFNHTNVVTWLNVLEANSEEEAKGIAADEALQTNPGHSISKVLVVAVPISDEELFKRFPPLLAAPTAKSKDSIRLELWAAVYTEHSNNNCNPEEWANKAVEKFDARFPNLCGTGGAGGTP